MGRTPKAHDEHVANLRELCRQAEELQEGTEELVSTLNRQIEETRSRHRLAPASASKKPDRRKHPRSR